MELHDSLRMGEALRAALEKDPTLYKCALIRRGPDQAPYLYRYYVAGEPEEGPSVYIHRMVSSDPDPVLHDHPWLESTSIILAGRYIEQRQNGAVRVLGPGDVNVILGSDYHRVLIEPGKEAWSLFFHGPRAKTWGFFDELTGKYREVTARLKNRESRSDELRSGPETDLVSVVPGVSESADAFGTIVCPDCKGEQDWPGATGEPRIKCFRCAGRGNVPYVEEDEVLVPGRRDS